MLNDSLVQQKNWFRFFPDGTIEFTVITRVIGLILLASLALITSAHRPMFLLGFAAVLWIDYAIVLWWAMQIGSDLENFSEARSTSTISRSRFQDMVLLTIPSIFVMLLVTPWPQILISKEAGRTRLMHVSTPALGLAFLIAAYFAWKTLQRQDRGLWIWRILILIPGLHWFATHRLIGDLQTQLNQRFQQKFETRLEQSNTALVAADVTLVLGIFFFLFWRGLGRTGGTLNAFLEAIVLGLAALFAVIDLAAMERLQRQFVTFIRKL